MRETSLLRVHRNLGEILTRWIKPPATDPPDRFYPDVIRELMRRHILFPNMRILVACGGMIDRDVLYDLHFSDVTITNLDVRPSGTEFQPFSWSYQNVENMAFDDNSFDFAIVHNGLHHCYSPHRGLLELYRVSRQGILVFEPRDTLYQSRLITPHWPAGLAGW
jgi:Methyltransferase domain